VLRPCLEDTQNICRVGTREACQEGDSACMHAVDVSVLLP
jgi:hypothetical protein